MSASRRRSFKKRLAFAILVFLRCILKKGALVVATVSGFIKCFELNDISILQSMGYTVHVATKIAEEDQELFRQRGVVAHHINFERFPFKKSNFTAIKQLKRIIEENDIDVIHCHTPVGGVIARIAAKKFRRNGCKVIYTAHGLQFYRGAPKKDWLIYYPIEKWLSRDTDVIITINHEDHQMVSKKFRNETTYYIPGVGVDLSRFGNPRVDREKKRLELGLIEKDTMLLSVGELIDRKNHRIVIDAVSKIGDPSLKYYIAGGGPLREALQQQIDDLGLNNRVVLLGARTDVNELLKCTELFVLPSKREGLSVALMESMAAGLPVVCSDIRGNVDLIDDDQGGYLCKVDSVDDYVDAITKLMNDKNQCKRFADHNQKKIQGFTIDVVDEKMRSIYHEILITT